MEVERGDSLVERDRRILDDRDVPCCRADEASQQLVRLAHLRFRLVFRLIAADRRLALEMLSERLQHNLGHQGRARVVQMNPVAASRSVAAPTVELGRDGEGSGSGRHVRKVAGRLSGLKTPYEPTHEPR